MEVYQIVGLAVMLGIGFVVHSMMSLNRLRRVMGVPKEVPNYRDLSVLRKPDRYDPMEVRLVRTHWLACVILFVLVLVLINVIPEDMLRQLEAPNPPG